MRMSPESALEIAASAKELTPMMRQYFEIKDQYKDAILFYRLGDFYEMFYDDALVASKILDLTLTTRNKNSPDPVPLCGVPHHAAESYIAKLIESGKKVAICEQIEDPKLAKTVVKREVVRVLSPGIVMEESSLPGKANNFLLCLKKVPQGFCAALCDVSTGSLESVFFESAFHVTDEIARMQVREILYPEGDRNVPEFLEIFKNLDVYYHAVSDLYFDLDHATDFLLNYFHVSTPSALGLEKNDIGIPALGGLLSYLKEIKILADDLLRQPVKRVTGNLLHLDEGTVRNLELFLTVNDQNKVGTLFAHLDHCLTPMGSRQLAQYLRFPLLDVSQINDRLTAVTEFLSSTSALDELRTVLNEIFDLERLANKFVAKIANARDALGLRKSLEILPQVRSVLSQVKNPLIQEILTSVFDFSNLVQNISMIIVEEPPLSLKEGGLVCSGFSAELDELRGIEKNGKNTIAQMEAQEKLRTGISSLKIRYNHVFGYYIEITNTHKEKAPANYIRKQTLSNAERYITEELKQYESKVLGASERIKQLEYEIFVNLRDQIQRECARIKETAIALAVLDVLQSFAYLARKHHYVKPEISKAPVLELKSAKHPILAELTSSFIPNDVVLDGKRQQVLIITGPNMAGKSTVMRTAALVVIMAQMGCYVPCESAIVGICDRVFTRVGAHDYLQKGMSTFMVEMVETAKILREATGKSLILLDEIGRGTSTFDGLSIAWAVAEDIHDRLFARTLFATHYHELCDLAEQKNGIQNFHMSVKEWNDEIIFLRKLKSGGTNRSYGVAVARMAGLALGTIKRAREILKLLELKDISFKSDLDKEHSNQISLFAQADSAVAQKIRDIDVDQMTPLQALQFLSELKREIG